MRVIAVIVSVSMYTERERELSPLVRDTLEEQFLTVLGEELKLDCSSSDSYPVCTLSLLSCPNNIHNNIDTVNKNITYENYTKLLH